jgi:lysozyme
LAPTPYNDAVGNCTIGYGHLIAPRPCRSADLAQVDHGKFARGLSEPEGLALLNEDTTIARCRGPGTGDGRLSNNQFGALTSFVFNIGRANFA